MREALQLAEMEEPDATASLKAAIRTCPTFSSM